MVVMVYCQQPASYFYSRIGKVNGLAADAAYCVQQDKDGYLWVGTENGLQRYDGVRFITFRHIENDEHSLPANTVESMFLDSKERLWLRIAGNKLGYFNVKTFKYTPVNLILPDNMRNREALRFKESSDGRISITVLGFGVVTYNPQINEFSSRHNIIQVDNFLPTEIVEDGKTGKYWVIGNKSMDVYDSHTKKYMPAAMDSSLSELTQYVRSRDALGPFEPFRDSSGLLWTRIWSYVPNDDGADVLCYNPSTKKWTSYKKNLDKIGGVYYVVDGILQQQNGDVWVYGTNLFAKLNKRKNEFENVMNESLKLHGIEVESIRNLFEDREKNIWIACTNGLYYFNPGNHIFNHMANERENNLLYNHATIAVLQTRQNLIYTTAWGAGIFTYDSNFNVVKNPITPTLKDNENLSVWDMHERENGEIWLGFQGGALGIYDQQTRKKNMLYLPIFGKHTIRQVIEDSLGNMWMGTQSGLVIKCINGNWKDTANAYRVIMKANGHVIKMVADSKGFIWVCTDTDGLIKLSAKDGSRVAHYNELAPKGKRLQAIGAADVLELNDSIMLVASSSVNVLNTRTQNITYITTEDGLPSSNSVSLIKDKQGYVWVTMQNGICRLWVGENYLVSFGLEDGVNNNHFQPNAATMLRDGRMVFGNSTGITTIDPSKVHVSTKPIPVYISGFKVFDKRLRVDSLLKLKKITLPYTDNSLTIDVTTHTFTQAYGILYKLEGIDKEWKMAVNKQILYSYLAPGRYELKTKVTQVERDEPEVETVLAIEIIPPVWNQWWFYALIVLIIAGLFYMADRERLARIRATEKLRTDIALNLHHDVNVALNNINLLSEMARMKADKDIVKSKELIEQISSKSNKMIIAMDDMLWSIDPANDSMEKTMLRMTEFADSLRMRHDADIVIRIDKNVSNLKLDMKLRHGFFLIFKEALRVLVQYSGGKHTLINIDLAKHNLYLKMHDDVVLDVDDDQVAKSIDEMKNFTAEIGAEIDIQSDKNGSDIVLLVTNVL